MARHRFETMSFCAALCWVKIANRQLATHAFLFLRDSIKCHIPHQVIKSMVQQNCNNSIVNALEPPSRWYQYTYMHTATYFIHIYIYDHIYIHTYNHIEKKVHGITSNVCLMIRYSWAPFNWHGLNLIPAYINNLTPIKVWESSQVFYWSL